MEGLLRGLQAPRRFLTDKRLEVLNSCWSTHELHSCVLIRSEFNPDAAQANEYNSFANISNLDRSAEPCNGLSK